MTLVGCHFGGEKAKKTKKRHTFVYLSLCVCVCVYEAVKLNNFSRGVNIKKPDNRTVVGFIALFASHPWRVAAELGNNCCPLNVTTVVISELSEPSNLFLDSTQIISVKIRDRRALRRVNDTPRIPQGTMDAAGTSSFASRGLQRL